MDSSSSNPQHGEDKHPFVSEAHEGDPVFEWAVAIVVVVSAILALLGHVQAGMLILTFTSFVTAIVRLVMRDKSPWKVRSAGFDCFIGFAFGVGLLATYYSFLFF